MDQKRITDRIAKSVTAQPKFTVSVDRNTSSGKRLVMLYSVLRYKGLDRGAMKHEFDEVENHSQGIVKAAAHALGAKFRMGGATLRVDTNPAEFEVIAIMIDDVSTPDETVYAFTEDRRVKQAWVK